MIALLDNLLLDNVKYFFHLEVVFLDTDDSHRKFQSFLAM